MGLRFRLWFPLVMGSGENQEHEESYLTTPTLPTVCSKSSVKICVAQNSNGTINAGGNTKRKNYITFMWPLFYKQFWGGSVNLHFSLTSSVQSADFDKQKWFIMTWHGMYYVTSEVGYRLYWVSNWGTMST